MKETEFCCLKFEDRQFESQCWNCNADNFVTSPNSLQSNDDIMEYEAATTISLLQTNYPINCFRN